MTRDLSYEQQLAAVAELARPAVLEILRDVEIEHVQEDGAITVYLKGPYIKVSERFAVRPSLQIGNLSSWNGQPLRRQFAIGADCEVCIGRLNGSNCVVGHPERIAAEAGQMNIDWKGLPSMEDLTAGSILDTRISYFEDAEAAIAYGVSRLRKLMGRAVKLSIVAKVKR